MDNVGGDALAEVRVMGTWDMGYDLVCYTGYNVAFKMQLSRRKSEKAF